MSTRGVTNWIGSTLTEEESILLLQGFEAGLISYDEAQGRLVLEGFAPDPLCRPKSYQVFGASNKNAHWMWREMFIQIGFGIELMLEAGWPGKLIAFETKGFDVVADPENPVIMAEAKQKAADLDEQFKVLSNEGKGGKPTDANRYADIQAHRPHMYAAVAWSTRRYYFINYASGLEFTPSDKPIQYSHV